MSSRPFTSISWYLIMRFATPMDFCRPATPTGSLLFAAPRPKRPSDPANPGREGGECAPAAAGAASAVTPSPALAGAQFSLLTAPLRGQHLLERHGHRIEALSSRSWEFVGARFLGELATANSSADSTQSDHTGSQNATRRGKEKVTARNYISRQNTSVQESVQRVPWPGPARSRGRGVSDGGRPPVGGRFRQPDRTPPFRLTPAFGLRSLRNNGHALSSF